MRAILARSKESNYHEVELMFENFSPRSVRVIFATRFKAGQRGADAVDVGDLVSGIIVEDQDMLGTLVEEGEPMGQVLGIEPHTHFFSQSLAPDLLAALERSLPRSNPIPTSVDMTTTADLSGILEAAESQRQKSYHQKVEPLHLLAAVLELPARPEIDLLKDAGITEEILQVKLKQM